MKFENFLLGGLLVACIAVASLIMAAMLTVRPGATQLAGSPRACAVVLSAPGSCVLPPDAAADARRHS